MKNISRVLKWSFIFIICICSSGCGYVGENISKNSISNPYAELGEPSYTKMNQQLMEKLKKERFLMLFNSSDKISANRKDNIGIVLDYMKKSFDTVDVSHAQKVDFQKYDYIVLTMEEIEKFPQLIDVFEQVKTGTGILFATRPAPYGKVFQSVKSIIGIKDSRGFADKVQGIKVLTDVLIKAKGFESTSQDFNGSAIDVDLDENCNVHIQDSKGKPLLWSKKYGNGNIVFYNGVSIESKINRGLLAGSISLLKDNFIYPVINAKVFNLDDFPAPIPEGTSDALNNMTVSKFIKSVWWPQMFEWDKEYKLKFSAFFIQSYDNLIEPPFRKNSLRMDKFQFTVADNLSEISGEQGLHGYNHQPLALEGFLKYDWGYQPWKSQKDMETAIKTSTNWFNMNFPKYKISSYVAPSNIVSKEGRQALINTLPYLKVVSGIYIDQYYGQEFGVGKDGIVDLPRVTSGFVYDDSSLWADYNSINLYGVYSHFVHPDDILDKARTKGHTWDWVKEDFTKTLKYLTESFPWLRPMTNTEVSFEIKKYTQIKPYVEYLENKLVVRNDNFVQSTYFIMRSKGKLSGDGCVIRAIDDGVYLIKADRAEFVIKVE